MFIKKNLQNFISDLEISNIKLGGGKKLGNKGSCAIRFKYKDTSMVFGCCHLDSTRTAEGIDIRKG